MKQAGVRAAAVTAALVVLAVSFAAADGPVDTSTREGDGALWAGESANFSLGVGFYGQLAAQAAKLDIYQQDNTGRPFPEYRDVQNIGETRTSIYIRTLRFWFNGKVFEPWIRYRIEIDALSNDRGLRREKVTYDPLGATEVIGISEHQTDQDYRTLKLLDMYLDFSPKTWFKVRAGQFKIPFGHQYLVPDNELQMLSRSVASDFFVPGRDRGVMVYGSTKAATFGWAAGAWNGGGLDQGRNLDPQLAYAGRLTLSSRGAYQVSESIIDDPRQFKVQGYASAFSSKNHVLMSTTYYPEHVDDVKDTREAIGIQLFWRRANLMAEGFARKLEIGDPHNNESLRVLAGNGCLAAYSAFRTTCEARGINVQGGYYFGESSEVSARWSKVDDDRTTPDDDRTEATVAYTWFFRRHAFRLTTTFSVEDLGFSSKGSSGYDLQTGRYPNVNENNLGNISTRANDPRVWPGLQNDRNRTLTVTLQRSL